jgi:acyl transferase domain-containing protein
VDGCGGSSGSGDGGAAFIRAGDAQCMSINDTIARVAKRTTSRIERAKQDRAILASAAQVRRRFGELKPPGKQRALVTQFLRAFDDKIAAVRALTVATERADRTSFARARADDHRADVSFNGLAQRIGFKICGYPSTGPPPAVK